MAEPTRMPEPGLEGGSTDRSTVDANAVREHSRLLARDTNLASFFVGLAEALASPLGGAPGSRTLDPVAVGRWFVNVGTQLGTFGIASFLAQQQVLYAFNPQLGEGRVFDPKYFLERLPILNSTSHVTLDDQGHREVAKIRDDSMADAVRLGGFGPTPPFTSFGDPTPPTEDLSTRNVYGPRQGNYVDGAEFTVRQIVDETFADGRPAFTEEVTLAGGIKRRRVDLSPLFSTDRITLGTRPSPLALGKLLGDVVVKGPLERMAYADGIVPASFPREGDDGAYEHAPDEMPVTDDEAYLPLAFTDLRPIETGRHPGQVRTVYFRPFNLTLSEEFAPDWSEEHYYGRVDPVLVYSSTTRTVNLSWQMVAFAPEDLKVIYQKLNWLASMVYPEYDNELLLRSGPVCRLRVGDVIKATGKGLPGVIRNLSHDYSESPWELSSDHKVPMYVNVAISFTALHESPIGRLGGGFGGLFRSLAGENVGKFAPFTGGFRGFGGLRRR